jgi:NAD(P)-dependent dehydrogenase (short-subunit alcohol dehydrogenase family)
MASEQLKELIGVSNTKIRFDNQVAIITGAGQGLGRAHALGLAARGAKVVVNDLGRAGAAASAVSETAESVAREIRALGGDAVAEGVNVTQMDQVEGMIARTIARWGRIDILVNNAGILRDKTFAKMDLADFRLVVEVHLMGSVHCIKAVLPHMRERGYGRIVLTSSASGIYGNFGQANYGAAKAAMIGLMNVLDLECSKYGIKINILAPTAATAMTAGLIEPEAAAQLSPESVTPGVLFLVSEAAPSKVILGAGAGCFARTLILETRGIYLPDAQRTPEVIAEHFAALSDLVGAEPLPSAFAQSTKYLRRKATEDA